MSYKNLNHGWSYIDYPNSITNKKTTMNPINEKDNKYFQYNVTVAFNHAEVKKKSARNN